MKMAVVQLFRLFYFILFSLLYIFSASEGIMKLPLMDGLMVHQDGSEIRCKSATCR